MSKKLLTISVSEKMYRIPRHLLSEYTGTRLGKLSEDPSQQISWGDFTSLKDEFVFNRPRASFEAILEFYQTGELHMPNNVCPKSFQKELEFWEISPDKMEDCCRFRFLTFFDDFDTVIQFKKTLNESEIQREALTDVTVGLWQRHRRKLWAVLDNKDHSILSQLVKWFMIVCVVTSVMTLSLGTVQSLRVNLDTCELRNYLDDVVTTDEYYRESLTLMKTVTNCTMSVTDIADHFEEELSDFRLLNSTHDNYTGSEIWEFYSSETTFETAIGKLKAIPTITKRHPVLMYIDFALLGIFTIELILRLLVCPSLLGYLMSVLNIIDIVVLVGTYVEIIVEYYYAKYRYEDKNLKFLYYLQMLRILRIIRYVQNAPSIRVLAYTFRSGYKDLSVVLIYFIIGIVTFANFAYFAEDHSVFKNIPESWWWAIITMTTVGYGDIVPKSAQGKVIGSLCALAGVLVLALTIPLFVNTFITLYQFSRIYKKLSLTDSVSPDVVTDLRAEKKKLTDSVSPDVVTDLRAEKK